MASRSGAGEATGRRRARAAARPLGRQGETTVAAHRHPGGEDCLVLRGGFRDRLGEYRAGDFVYYAPGSVHYDVQALAGEDCMLFVVAHGGLELLPAVAPS